MNRVMFSCDAEVAKEVLTAEELMILKALTIKVTTEQEKRAELTRAELKKASLAAKKEVEKNEKEIFASIWREYLEAINSTTEEVTEELAMHFLTSIFEKNGIIVKKQKHKESSILDFMGIPKDLQDLLNKDDKEDRSDIPVLPLSVGTLIYLFGK